jgi:oligosaccharide reducing-end xylanase
MSSTCQGGQCRPGGTQTCGEFACRALACLKSCGMDTDCSSPNLCDSGSKQCVDPTAARIARVAVSPVIDGTRDATWDTAPFFPLQNTILGSIRNDNDLEGRFAVVWDASALYILAIVSDDQVVSDSTYPWEDDCVELFIDGNQSRGTSYDANDVQYVFRVGAQDAREVSKGKIAGVTYAVKATAQGYVAEIRVPFSAIGVQGFNGKRIGIDVHVDDDDDGGSRDAKLSWWGTADNAWRDPSALGRAYLLDRL